MNASQLRMQMNILGPIDEGVRFDARTKWRLQWALNYTDNTHDCSVSSATVNLDIQTLFPTWRDNENADVTLRNQWSNYLVSLRSHEQNHIEHGKRAAEEVESTLLHLPAMENCQLLTAAANADAERIITAYQMKDSQYDIDTQHGRREGVSFP